MKESTPRTRASRQDEHVQETAAAGEPPDGASHGAREPTERELGGGPETSAAEGAAEGGETRGDRGAPAGFRTEASTDAESAADQIATHAEELRRELDEVNDRFLRLAAEFNNYRRRQEQERLETWSRAQGELLSRLLDVFDDIDRVAALDLSNATVEAIMEGVDLVARKIVRALEESDVEVIDPKDEPFDPTRMEAMMRVPAPSPDFDDRIAQVLQKGYEIKGILVRPARVAVYKAD